MNAEQHVHDLELAAFVDGGLDPVSRRRVEAHLLACEVCRAVVAEAGAFVEPARAARPRRRTLFAAGTLAAAAAIALLTVVLGRPSLESPARTRDVEAVGRAGLAFAPAAPPDGARIRADTLSFHWRTAGAEATYQITISSSTGAIVWTSRTLDTSLTLPRTVASGLESGRSYYWQVDAVLPDLRSATTGPRRFTRLRP